MALFLNLIQVDLSSLFIYLEDFKTGFVLSRNHQLNIPNKCIKLLFRCSTDSYDASNLLVLIMTHYLSNS